MIKIAPIILSFTLSFSHLLCASEQLLSKKDVYEKIQEAFDYHFLYKKVDKELALRIGKNFVQQLDYSKCYFTEEEVQTWINPSEELLEERMKAWMNGDFSHFFHITDLFKETIYRRAQIEQEIQNSPQFNTVLSKKDVSTQEWCENLEELRQRLSNLRHLQKQVVSELYPDQAQKHLDKLLSWRKEREEKFTQASRAKYESEIYVNILKAYASALDSHSLYFTQKEATDYVNDLNKKFSGIGVRLKEEVDGYRIMQILENGPAYKSGQLRVDDRIVAVDGQAILDIDLVKGVQLIQGPPGSTVQLTMQRNSQGNSQGNPQAEQKKDSSELSLGEPSTKQTFTISIQRDEISMEEQRYDVQIEKFGDGVIGVLRLYSFYADGKNRSSSDLRQQIINLQNEHNLKAVVLDLRYNTGGYLIEAVEVAGLFLKPGVIVGIKDHKENIQYLRNLHLTPQWEGPLVVLTNRASASSSEILAAALQDYGRSLTLGDSQTYGKGTFQLFLKGTDEGFDPKGVLTITQGNYYTVSGKSPQLTGVKPTIVIPGPLEYEEYGEQFTTYPLPNDSIAPTYEDTMTDLSFFERQYMKRWYTQHQQKRLTNLNKFVELLKSNSENRQQAHSDYQRYLSKRKNQSSHENDEHEPAWDPNENFDFADYQLREALNVTKDLLYLFPETEQANSLPKLTMEHEEELKDAS